MSTTIRLLGVPIEVLARSEVHERFERFMQEPRAHQISTVNPEFLVAAHRDGRYHDTLSRVDLATADGAGIIVVAKILGYRVNLSQRLTGVDLTMELLAFAEERGLPSAILLKDNSISDEATIVQKLNTAFPKLACAVFREPIDLSALQKFRPTVVFVAYGSPEQEYWIADHAHAIPSIRIASGVGGTFDFISGRIKRAPRILRSAGLEWLWRLALEPKRLRRIVRAVIVFPYLALTRR